MKDPGRESSALLKCVFGLGAWPNGHTFHFFFIFLCLHLSMECFVIPSRSLRRLHSKRANAGAKHFIDENGITSDPGGPMSRPCMNPNLI